MWQSKKSLKKDYDSEYLKQAEPYSYYVLNKDSNYNIDSNEGEHENVPFICMNKDSDENERHYIYEYKDYLIYENKKGYSNDIEKLELVTEAEKLNADLIYSDIDHITCDGKRMFPFFKPDFGIDTFRCFDYIDDLYAVKKNKSKTCYELLDNIAHVTKVLFHYNIGDTLQTEDNIHRYNTKCYIIDDIESLNNETSEIKDKVSVIIPSKDNPDLIKTCIDGIKKAKIKSGINAIEVVIIDNGSSAEHKREISHVIENISDEELKVKYIYEPAEFNFSAMCNRGVEESSGDYLLFLNDDIEVTDDLFLLKLLYFAKMDHIGAVGCKLLYPGEEKRIQHTGITCLKYPGPSHKLSTFEDSRSYYFGRNKGVHNCLAVTGACLMVSREKYYKAGGFCDKIKVGYNDVDLCVSLYEKGYLNVVNNECVLIHHESITRGADSASEEKLSRLDDERNLLYKRHPWIMEKGDPYYNPNLAGDFLDYRVNVIPDFERRDFVSAIHKELAGNVKYDGAPAKNLFFNIENRNRNRKYYDISGWAIVNKKDNYLFDTYLVVMNTDGDVNVFSTVPVRRSDLQTVFPDARYTELSGFFARVPSEHIKQENQKYLSQFGVLMINKQTGKKYYARFREADI